MIAVFGATGKLGGAAATELRRREVAVRAVTRDVAKGARLVEIGCAVARADLYDRASLGEAMRGAERVLVICPIRASAEDLVADAQRILDALGAAIEDARPHGVVAISDYGAQHASGTGITMIFRHLEDRLGATGVPTLFLRSAEHMQNWARQARVVRAQSVLPSLHHPITKLFPTVSAQDVGLVAAAILAAPGELPAGVIHVEGPRRVSAEGIAEVVGRLVGKSVTARAVPRDEWQQVLEAGGVPGSYARLVCELQDAHNAGRIDFGPGGEVRRGTTELEEALAPYFARSAPA